MKWQLQDHNPATAMGSVRFAANHEDFLDQQNNLIRFRIPDLYD
jgi:hypothetical protein